MGKFQVIDHPLIQHKLTIIRDKNSGTKVFREVVDEIAMLMAYEISRDLPVEEVEIETPMMKSVQKKLAGKKVAIIPILRAGLGMVDGILQLILTKKSCCWKSISLASPSGFHKWSAASQFSVTIQKR